MASSSKAPSSRRSVFDAAHIRSEFSAAGISAHFIPLIWKYASLRQITGDRHNPARLPLHVPKFYFIFLFNLSDPLCVRRYVLQNPRCSDLDGVPSLPAAAYALLRQKFRPTTSTLTAAADSKDRTTTKLLICLQVICTARNVAFGVRKHATHWRSGDYAKLGIRCRLPDYFPS
jgi:hypothetical protein